MLYWKKKKRKGHEWEIENREWTSPSEINPSLPPSLDLALWFPQKSFLSFHDLRKKFSIAATPDVLNPSFLCSFVLELWTDFSKSALSVN